MAKENLSQLAGLVAAAALLIDYVMTVAVSTASAIGQIVSVVPELDAVKIEIAVVVIFLITVANLRGLRESGNIFAIPTYAFVVPGPADGRRSGSSTSRPARPIRSTRRTPTC